MNPAYELNGKPVSRQDFYKIACDPQRHIAVEACAGAGKTWMLVSRILRALLDGAAPHEILAITFTKKAAGEMRERLTQWLEKFAHESDEQLLQELLIRGVAPARAQELVQPLRQLYPQLLAQGRSVQIRTFHGWFAALLRMAPLSVLEKLGLPAGYDLLEDDAPAVAQVWRPFHARLLQDADVRQDYELAVAVHGRYQTERALEAALQRRVEFTLADTQGAVLSSVPHFKQLFPEFLGADEPLHLLLSGELHERLLAAAQTLGRASQPTFSAKGSELEQALTRGDVEGVQAALLTKDGTARKFSDKVVGIAQVRAVQEQLLHLRQADAQHQAWLHQQRMTRLTRVLIDEFSALKRVRGWVDMNDVERAALYLMADPVLGGWVQERLDARTRHLLIDEFQDTNPLQWQALHAWLSGYGGAGGGAGGPSLFIVGDPKQSIYRFRRAEPQVFIAAQAFVRELGGEQLSCDHTQRNAPAVLALINQVMEQAQTNDAYPGFRTHTTESGKSGAVYALAQIVRPDSAQAEDEADEAIGWRDSLITPRVTPEETLRTLECRQAAQWLVAQIVAGWQPKDIMVLARKRDRLSVMQDELRALGIAAQQPEKTELGEAPEVLDLVALLDALVSPAHDLSLAQALKSPLFGTTDADLVQLALLQRELKQPWFDLLQAESLPTTVQHLGAVLMRWKGWVDTLPPHDALAAIFDDGDVLARFAAAAPATLRAAVLANLQAMLAAALQLDGGRYATPYALVRALKAGGVPAPTLADADAVRLLTVHGAKGLEAPLVLLLDTDAQEARAQTMGVLLDWPGEAAAPLSFTFLASESRLPPSVVQAMAVEESAREREELNALYVAMTRAQTQLVLSSVQPRLPSAGSWWQRLQPGCAALEVTVAAPMASALPHEEPILLPVLPVLPSAPEPAPEAKAAVTTLVSRATPESLIGQAMHRLLEWAPLGLADWPADQVRRAAQEFGLDTAQASQAAAMARRILHGAGAWAWHAQGLDWHANEVPVSVQGSVRRIDRLVRRKTPGAAGVWWVLDYKSASQPQGKEELLAQLRGYRAAVQAAVQVTSAGETVRAAFLSAQGTVEEIE